MSDVIHLGNGPSEGDGAPPREVRRHVVRAQLPWRPPEWMTECGREAKPGDGSPGPDGGDMTQAQFIALLNSQGRERMAWVTCMTCWRTTANWPGTWDQDPAAVLARHCSQERQFRRPARSQTRLADELRALAMLARAHPDEFAETVAGLQSAVSLTARRAARAATPRRRR